MPPYLFVDSKPCVSSLGCLFPNWSNITMILLWRDSPVWHRAHIFHMFDMCCIIQWICQLSLRLTSYKNYKLRSFSDDMMFSFFQAVGSWSKSTLMRLVLTGYLSPTEWPRIRTTLNISVFSLQFEWLSHSIFIHNYATVLIKIHFFHMISVFWLLDIFVLCIKWDSDHHWFSQISIWHDMQLSRPRPLSLFPIWKLSLLITTVGITST